jgi:hypothetical protein
MELMGVVTLNSKSFGNEHGSTEVRHNSKLPWNAYGSNPPVVVDKERKFLWLFYCKRLFIKTNELWFSINYLQVL